MNFSVVIPTCDRPDSLALCLERLAPGAQTLPADAYEVIVSDDGKSAATAALVRERFPWARWERGPQRGPAANRNHGATLARGDWLVFTDDDCLPDAGWLAAYARAAAPDTNVIEGRTRAPGPRLHPLDDCPANEHGGNLWSCNFAIRRALFAELRGFDERFPYPAMEDAELNARLQKRGERVTFVPDALVVHPWKRIRNWSEHRRRHLASRRLMEALHPGRGFPGTPWQAAKIVARLALREHVPFLCRHPAEGIRTLPALWLSLSAEIWLAWRKPAEQPSASPASPS